MSLIVNYNNMGPRMATNMLITMLISYTSVNIAVSQLCVVFLTCAFLGIVSKVNKQTCASSMPFSFYCKFLKTTWKDRAQLHSIKGQLHYSIDIAVSTINRTVIGRASFQENIYISYRIIPDEETPQHQHHRLLERFLKISWPECMIAPHPGSGGNSNLATQQNFLFEKARY